MSHKKKKDTVKAEVASSSGPSNQPDEENVNLHLQQENEEQRKLIHDMTGQHDAALSRIAMLEAQLAAKMEHKDVVGGNGGSGRGSHVVAVEHNNDDPLDHSSDDGHDDVDAGVTSAVKLPKIPSSLKPFNGEGGASVRLWLQSFDPLDWLFVGMTINL